MKIWVSVLSVGNTQCLKVRKKMKVKKYDYICEECGGELKVNAWVVWDADKQDFIIDNVWSDDDRWCVDCNCEATIKEVEVANEG